VFRFSARIWLTLSVSAFLLADRATVEAQDGWVKIFDGRDLSGFETWLGVPHKAVTGLSLPRNAEGAYTEALGTADPKQVYSVVQHDGAPAIRISGEIFGALTGKQEYDDFHLKLQFKWGEKKWPPRENVVRDSGILYYAVGPHGASGNNKAWMRSLECQVQEGDVGDYWGVAGAIVDVEGDRTGEGKDQKTVYRTGSPVVSIDGSPRRAIKAFDNEKAGAWNTVEVLCAKGTCVHVVNGKVNLVLTNPRQPKEGGGNEPLLKGKLQIQSEGAEVFYRDIQVRRIAEIPKEYRP
jgi:hypothetical protein